MNVSSVKAWFFDILNRKRLKSQMIEMNESEA